jgi:hypothetical protein
MEITEKTLSAIKTHILPPYCMSLDMAEILIKNLLKRSQFTVDELSKLSEEEGLQLLHFFQNVFAADRRQTVIEEIIDDQREAAKK